MARCGITQYSNGASFNILGLIDLVLNVHSAGWLSLSWAVALSPRDSIKSALLLAHIGGHIEVMADRCPFTAWIVFARDQFGDYRLLVVKPACSLACLYCSDRTAVPFRDRDRWLGRGSLVCSDSITNTEQLVSG